MQNVPTDRNREKQVIYTDPTFIISKLHAASPTPQFFRVWRTSTKHFEDQELPPRPAPPAVDNRRRLEGGSQSPDTLVDCPLQDWRVTWLRQFLLGPLLPRYPTSYSPAMV